MNDINISLNILENPTTGEIVAVEVSFPLLERKNPSSFVVQCPLFKTIGYSANSLEDAQKDHETDLAIFFKSHIQRNTLKTALEALGWRKGSTSFKNYVIPEYELSHAALKTAVVYA